MMCASAHRLNNTWHIGIGVFKCEETYSYLLGLLIFPWHSVWFTSCATSVMFLDKEGEKRALKFTESLLKISFSPFWQLTLDFIAQSPKLSLEPQICLSQFLIGVPTWGSPALSHWTFLSVLSFPTKSAPPVFPVFIDDSTIDLVARATIFKCLSEDVSLLPLSPNCIT